MADLGPGERRVAPQRQAWQGVKEMGGGPRLTDRQAALVAALKRRLDNQRVLTAPHELVAYSYDATGRQHWPDVVVVAEEARQVGTVLDVANQFGVPVVARGAGTNLSGGSLAVNGGIVLSLADLTALGPVLPTAHRFAAEPGVVNGEAQRALREAGWFYPPDPASHQTSTLGGNVAEGAGGPHCVKYGVTTQYVEGVEGYLANGQPFAWDNRNVPGEWDVVGLLVGSEGTLAVFTRLWLAMRPLPPARGTLLAAFRSSVDACRAAARLIAAGVEVAALELMDRRTIAVVEPFVRAGYPREAGAVLLTEIEGDSPAVLEGLEAAEAVAFETGAVDLRRATSEAEQARLWLGRRAAYGALARQAPRVWIQDVTVPRPALPAMMDRVEAVAARHRLTLFTIAHAGDGNLHPTMAFDPMDAAQVAAVRAADEEILAGCVELGGSITGEHGVGIDKWAAMAIMLGPAERRMLARIKAAWDPEGRLNPGKAIGPVDEAMAEAASVTAAATAEPREEAEVTAAIREVLVQRRRLVPVGSGRRLRAVPPDVLRLQLVGLSGVLEVDPENWSAVVRAGTTMAELDAALRPYGLEWAVDALAPTETVGGVVAAAMPNFRGAGVGAVRDQVLGMEVVDGRGDRLRFGRAVTKNVAGYDVPRLLVGSGGGLGVITRVILRLRPRRPLVWFRRAGTLAEQAVWAADRLRAYPWPQALVSTPAGLVWAWPKGRADARDGEAEPIPDPRPEWGRAIADRWGRHRFGALPATAVGDAPAGFWMIWWPERVAFADGGWIAAVCRPPRVLPAGLAEGLRAAWDPHGVFWQQPREPA